MNRLPAIDRRSLLQGALALAGATAANVCDAKALAKAVASGSRYLDAPTFDLLGAVADTIIPKTDTPGALAAGVPAKFDALLANWASGQHRVALTQALSAIDRRARGEAGSSFTALSPAARKDLLVRYDAAALKPVPRTGDVVFFKSTPSVADPDYAALKELVVTLYYYSETALTTELPYEHAPGEWQPSIPVTPATRNPGSVSPF